jgi:hypothetical protein
LADNLVRPVKEIRLYGDYITALRFLFEMFNVSAHFHDAFDLPDMVAEACTPFAS